MNELMTFWNNKHPLTETSIALYDKLVPSDGHCDTLQGELLRASTRISYDWFNNGWGCNNWSGAVVFIEKHIADLPVALSREDAVELNQHLSYVQEFSHGEPSPRHRDAVELKVTRIHAIVVGALVANPDLIPNTTNMFEYQEEDYKPEEEDDEPDYDHDDE